MGEIGKRLAKQIALEQVVWKREPEILLCPNIPQPLYGTAPRVVLGTKWWNQERQKAYRSTNYHCQACGVPKLEAKYHQWLEGHEVYYIDYRKGRMTFIRTVPLCHFCHNFIHDGRMRWLVQSGKLHHAKFTAIMQHGESVLAAAGLVKVNNNEAILKLVAEGGTPPHDDWRLIIEGVEYSPLHSLQEIMSKEPE